MMLQQSSQSLVEICLYLAIENPIVALVPSEIRCENYVPLNIHLVRLRSVLQEKKVNIEEKTIRLWQEQTNEQEETDKSHFQSYSTLDDPSHFSEYEEDNTQSIPSSPSVAKENTIDEIDSVHACSSSSQQEIAEDSHLEEPLVYSSLFTFDMRLVPCSSLNFLQQLHQFRMEGTAEGINITKAQKFTITHPDGTTSGFMYKVDKFQERLRKIFGDYHYDHGQYVLIDKNEIFFDFNKDEFHSSQISSVTYRIVERKHLTCVEFQHHSSTIEYLTTSTNRIAAVIKHFMDVNQRKDNTTDTYLCFFDQHGGCIEDVSVEDLHEKKKKLVTVVVKELTSINNSVCEIHLTGGKSNNR
ncbi:unnamed protein product [Rotaria sp. Silwood1]|nr:unnamed protein product [Rotaria sp. Silwood1]